jgi:anti-sigma B factor antagonist
MSTERIPLLGDLDLATVESFVAAIGATSADVIEVDASGLGFIDSTGLRALLTARADLASQGRRLRLVERSSALIRLLEISRVTDVFDD